MGHKLNSQKITIKTWENKLRSKKVNPSRRSKRFSNLTTNRLTKLTTEIKEINSIKV